MRRNSRNRNRILKKKNDINYSKVQKSLIVIVSILFILLIVIACFNYIKNRNDYQNLIDTSKQEIENQKQENAKKEAEENKEEEPTDTTLTMAAIGDIMCHNTQYNDAYNKDTGAYDFSYVFDDISLYTKTADICIGNLETTFAGEDVGYSGYPTFNTPDSLAYELKDIGVDVLSTAGNHALDKGFNGLSRTIDVLNDADIAHTGTYKTEEEQNTILTKYVKGIKIAFVNFTYGTNGIKIPSGKEFCVNLIDNDLITKQLDLAKSQNPDIIVACMHWGNEYKTTPNDTQKELSTFLFQNGVDIILGTHPHVLEPMEKQTVTLEDGTTKDGFVIYSLGNFISGQTAENTKTSIILNLTITKHTDGKITIDKAEYKPIYMYTDKSLKTKKMKLLDINKNIYNYENYIDSTINKTFYDTLKSEQEKVTKIVGEELK